MKPKRKPNLTLQNKEVTNLHKMREINLIYKIRSSSAKLPVILSPSHLVIWSFGHWVTYSLGYSVTR